MKQPLAYITAAWSDNEKKDRLKAARYCRAVYEAGFSPVCPMLYLPLFLNGEAPAEHEAGVSMGRDLLRRSRVLVVCGDYVDEAVKRDIALAERLSITATTLEGILTIREHGRGEVL